MGKQCVILENHTDMASFRRDPPAAAGRQPSAYIDLTRIGCLETGDNSQRRGLAAPAGSQQAQDLAVPTLQPTHDRVMATAVTSQWWHTQTEDVDWGSPTRVRLLTMSDVFAGHHSLALQQTMYAMGEAMITEQPEIGEVRFSLPNKHHFVIDLSPYGLENQNEVFYAADRPTDFIEGTVHNADAPASGLAFDPGQGW